jgi:hypothetical protein
MFLASKLKKMMQRFSQNMLCFILQAARISCPETPVTNTNLRHVNSEKSESLKPAPLARTGATVGKSRAVFEQRNTQLRFL